MHDNVILLTEIVSIIGKSKRKHPYFIIKLDLETAFDRVSWMAIKQLQALSDVSLVLTPNHLRAARALGKGTLIPIPIHNCATTFISID
ncbi:hypothetical protein Cni_G06655 [Canna indica]|uniref:Reverse transcriptase domain-containing protein n=1 Tax=Canna indica TaxID=4628 RepID=A0AAQ3JXG6_9LILI|nr:hypothetical protein Cni_G06655 [Canna indica]